MSEQHIPVEPTAAGAKSAGTGGRSRSMSARKEPAASPSPADTSAAASTTASAPASGAGPASASGAAEHTATSSASTPAAKGDGTGQAATAVLPKAAPASEAAPESASPAAPESASPAAPVAEAKGGPKTESKSPAPKPSTGATDAKPGSDAKPAPATKTPPAEPARPMEEADRHGFIAAFIGGVRPEADQARSSRRLLVIGTAVAVAAGLAALVVGAIGSGGGKPAAKAAPSPTLGAVPVGDSHSAPAAPQAPAAPGVAAPAVGAGAGAGAGVGAGVGSNPVVSNGGQPNTPVQQPAAGPAAQAPAVPASPAAQQPQQGAPNAPAAQPAAPAKPTYTAVAGPNCSDGSTGFLGKDADFTLGIGGWLRSSQGGYSGDGCDGTYYSEPMSGSANSYDKTQGALWHWNFGSMFDSASCRLSIYVPNNSNIQYVGGNPTQYYLFGQDYEYGMNVAPISTFSLTQVGNLGQWLDGGTFGVSSGQVTLKMVNTGIDYTSSTSHAHDAAAAARLTCQAQ